MSNARAALLAGYIADRLSTPFEWGRHDCVLFTVSWIKLATGRDYISAYRPWSNERDAMRLVRQLGGLEAIFDQHFLRIEPNYANDGDVALIDGTAYLFTGAQVVSVGERGLIFRPRTEAACAWSF